MFPMFRKLLALLLLSAGAVTAQAAICRVAADGDALADGSTWSTATTLPAALLEVGCTEIWLKQGLYRAPYDGFAIERPLHLYGGFKGNEATRAQRATNSRLTVLTGDIDGDDTVDAQGIVHTPADIVDMPGGNASHVLTIGGLGTEGNGVYTPANTVIDGLTLTGGNAITSTSYHVYGAGLFCNGNGAGKECSPRISHVTFSGNHARFGGGAMTAMAGDGGKSSPEITHSLFTGNTTDGGSGRGGALQFEGYLGGTIHPRISQSTFTDLVGDLGAAIYLYADTVQGSLQLEFSTLEDNTATYGVIYGKGVAVNVAHSIIWGTWLGEVIYLEDGDSVAASLGSLSGNYIEDGCTRVEPSALCAGSPSDIDPELGPLADNGGPTWTHLPSVGSPVRFVWTCSAGETDQRGAQRPTGGDACDAGAVQQSDTIPAAPASFTVGGGEVRQMSLSWSAVPGAVDYVVEDLTGGGAPVEVCRTSGTECVFSGLGDADTRSLRVRALNELGASGPTVGGATTYAVAAAAPAGAVAIPTLSPVAFGVLVSFLAGIGGFAVPRRRS